MQKEHNKEKEKRGIQKERYIERIKIKRTKERKPIYEWRDGERKSRKTDRERKK